MSSGLWRSFGRHGRPSLAPEIQGRFEDGWACADAQASISSAAMAAGLERPGRARPPLGTVVLRRSSVLRHGPGGAGRCRRMALPSAPAALWVLAAIAGGSR